jgi:hypothetical protein
MTRLEALGDRIVEWLDGDLSSDPPPMPVVIMTLVARVVGVKRPGVKTLTW